MTQHPSQSAASRSAAWRLAAFYGGVFLAMGIFGPFWPLWLKDRGLDAHDIGLVFALGTLAKLIMTPFVARWADRLGRRKILLVFLTTAGTLVFISFRWAEGLLPIALITIVYFACWGPVSPLTESLTMLTRDQVPEGRRPFDYGRVRLWGSVTFIIGAWGMGLILTDAPISWVHWAVLGAVALTTLAAFALPDTRTAPAEPGGQLFRPVLREPGMIWAILAATFVQASHIAYYNFGSIHWENAGHSPDVIGALWAEGVVVEIVLFSVSTLVVARVGALPLILIGAVAASARWLGTGLSTEIIWLVPLQALHALSFGATHLGIIHLISERIAPSRSASAQSLYAMALGLGFSAASYGAGILFQSMAGGAFTVMAGMSGIGALFAIGALWAAGSRLAKT